MLQFVFRNILSALFGSSFTKISARSKPTTLSTAEPVFEWFYGINESSVMVMKN